MQQERRCYLSACASDCIVSEWTEWSACGASCGGGQQTRQRSVLSPPVEDGAACPQLLETRECNTFSCDGGCHVGEWGEWTECSKPCEGGSKTRTRTVRALEADTDCPPSTQTAPCNLHDCGKQQLNLLRCTDPCPSLTSTTYLILRSIITQLQSVAAVSSCLFVSAANSTCAAPSPRSLSPPLPFRCLLQQSLNLFPCACCLSEPCGVAYILLLSSLCSC